MQQSNPTASNHGAAGKRVAPDRDLVETAAAAGTFTTLLAGLKSAGLTQKLSGRGPFTVFAPTDAAFEKLPRGALEALLKDVGKLKAVLSYHLIAGHVLAKDIGAGEVMTLQLSTMTAAVTAAGVSVNGARLEPVDIEATNGVIHVIDTVILPKHWQLLAAAA
jgi:uncharacterized surface protein with fasciclin (FAS1) repeats